MATTWLLGGPRREERQRAGCDELAEPGDGLVYFSDDKAGSAANISTGQTDRADLSVATLDT
ncbi:MAG: hypothetical protein ACLPQS_06825 [Acidimicrobiales bacterium]